MAYATAEDMRARFSDRMLAHVTDPLGKEVQAEALTRALADASAEADAYLSRFTLPLPSVPSALKRHVCNMALYDLLNLRPQGDMEDARRRYTDALDFLEMVSKGKLDLGLSEAGQAVPVSAEAIAYSAPRVFTFDSMGSM